MTIDQLHGELAYLGSPYSKRAEKLGGLGAAYIEACQLTARLIQAGVRVFSPICHSHGIALHGNIDPLDQTFWTDFDAVMLHVCRVLIVAHLDGWQESTGIAHEIEFFEQRGRPIFDLPDPHGSSLTMIRRPPLARSVASTERG